MKNVRVKQAVPAEYIAEGNYGELIQVFAYEFAVHYVAGEIRIYGTQNRAYDRRPKWQFNGAVKIAREYVAAQIAALGEEFMQKHRALYELA